MNKKAGFIGIMLAGVLALSCITVPAAEKTYTEQTRIGNIDADSNGTIGIDDATQLQRILAEVVAGDAWKRDACTKRTMDVNLDDTVNIQDVTELQRYLAELPTPYIGSTVRAVYGGRVTYPDTYAQRMLQNTVNKYHFEGVACIIQNGELTAFSATGTADPQTGAPANTKSRFCVGSLSKQITAAAVMLLQERGALRTDDLLSQYFPECPYGSKVTLRQMLKMRSGIAEFYEESDDGYNINELPVGSLKNTLTNNGTTQQNRELLQSWLFAQPLTFTPGSKCVYCNSNYFLLARLVEKVSGMSYETFVTQNILQPLGMTETCFIDEGLGDPRVAKNAHTAKTVYVGITMGLGDIITTVSDMQRWMTSFFGTSLLSSGSIRAMTYSDSYSGYGYGVVPFGDGAWCHYGIFTSYAAFDYVSPKDRYAVFVVTNNRSTLAGEVNSMCFELNDLLL